MQLIEFKKVSFSYFRKDIFKDLDFTIGSNEFLLLAGENGKGKTTLIKLLLNILKPLSGAIFRNLEDMHQIGYLPQLSNIDPKFPITVRSVVLMGTLGHNFFGRYLPQDILAANNALKEVDMFEHADAPFGSLSGGMQQRVLIARSITCDPKLLILDEPFSFLDAVSANSLIDLLYKLKKRMAILLVSHNCKIVADQITRIFSLSESDIDWKSF